MILLTFFEKISCKRGEFMTHNQRTKKIYGVNFFSSPLLPRANRQLFHQKYGSQKTVNWATTNLLRPPHSHVSHANRIVGEQESKRRKLRSGFMCLHKSDKGKLSLILTTELQTLIVMRNLTFHATTLPSRKLTRTTPHQN